MKNIVVCCKEMEVMLNQKGSDYKISYEKIGSFKNESGVYFKNVLDEKSGLIMKMTYCPFCGRILQVK